MPVIAGFRKTQKPALVVPAFEFFKKNEETGVGNAGFENFKFSETGVGNAGFATCTKRTTLVKFLKLDVDYGFFIFGESDPYKTLQF